MKYLNVKTIISCISIITINDIISIYIYDFYNYIFII